MIVTIQRVLVTSQFVASGPPATPSRREGQAPGLELGAGPGAFATASGPAAPAPSGLASHGEPPPVTGIQYLSGRAASVPVWQCQPEPESRWHPPA